MVLAQKNIFDLPEICIFIIISFLDSSDILSLAYCCKYFQSLIEKDFSMEISFPLLVPEDTFLSLKRKKVLKLSLLIEGGGQYEDIDWKDAEVHVLNTAEIVRQLKHFKTEETVELNINFDCSKLNVPMQEKQDYKDLKDIVNKMTQLKKCKIDIMSTFKDSRLSWIHYIHISNILRLCYATELVLKFPNMHLEKHSIPLDLSNIAKKITIIGPCKGLFLTSTRVICINAKELIVQPLKKQCTLHSDSIHNNGICVVHLKSILKNNPNLQFYNGIFVGNSCMMEECCHHSVLAERFYNDYVKKGGRFSKYMWLSCWNKVKPLTI